MAEDNKGTTTVPIKQQNTAKMTANKQKSNTSRGEKSSSAPDSEKKDVPDEEVRQESSKAANAAIAAQKKSKQLKDAAAGAGNPDERQKLMEQAIDAQIEAESFGKTAKYLRSGAFQGLAIGTGLGVAPGATLGAVTGTLVGGITSTITGGLGGGIGTAAGVLHGPIWNLGEMAGKGVRKFTGDLPGWAASDEQKQALEKMIGQVQEEDMPDESELQKLHEEGGSAIPDEGWMKSVKNMMPSLGSADKSSKQAEPADDKGKSAQPSETNEGKTKDSRIRKQPRKLGTKSNGNNVETGKPSGTRKKPRKLEARSDNSDAKPAKAPPKKLETRS